MPIFADICSHSYFPRLSFLLRCILIATDLMVQGYPGWSEAIFIGPDLSYWIVDDPGPSFSSMIRWWTSGITDCMMHDADYTGRTLRKLNFKVWIIWLWSMLRLRPCLRWTGSWTKVGRILSTQSGLCGKEFLDWELFKPGTRTCLSLCSWAAEER